MYSNSNSVKTDSSRCAISFGLFLCALVSAFRLARQRVNCAAGTRSIGQMLDHRERWCLQPLCRVRGLLQHHQPNVGEPGGYTHSLEFDIALSRLLLALVVGFAMKICVRRCCLRRFPFRGNQPPVWLSLRLSPTFTVPGNLFPLLIELFFIFIFILLLFFFFFTFFLCPHSIA